MYIYIKIGDLSMIDPCDSEEKSEPISSLKQQREELCFSSLAREKITSRCRYVKYATSILSFLFSS